MQLTFLLGPAGSGKTQRCLAEIRAELLASPDGPPLILLAPRQATFQLERQLLADASLAGYTRLHILSFERLAEFVFDQTPVPKLLSTEGRVMVLRALLGQRQSELKVFHASARLPGFAHQLSSLLRELQQHHLSAAKLESLAARIGAAHRLDAKLHDLALLLRAYLDWLKQHKLEDADRLLDLAADALKSPLAPRPSPLAIAGLWLDGFAEMTPQELDLLAALVPCCERATLAFCLEGELKEDASWLSPWSVVGQTFQRCHQRMVALSEVSVEVLPRDPTKSRFAGNPVLQHVERHWTEPQSFTICDLRFTNGQLRNVSTDHFTGNEADLTIGHLQSAIRLAACPNPEAEAILAAGEILRLVRGGGRYRDCAMLLRNLEGYHDVLRRVFSRYGIPFFLDRREPVTHHPLAELTRYALRLIAFGWRQDDWFGALKTGLVPARDEEIDWLENAALEFGWAGQAWQEPLQIPDDSKLSERAERLRQKLVPPFARLADTLAAAERPPTGVQLAQSIAKLWSDLRVEQRLAEWAGSEIGNRKSKIENSQHSTVWEQMNAWLDNLALAFANEPMPLRDWLPVLEAGLGTLTVGVIPPALDQVLIGAVDRSRNPDLKLALLLGLNEGIFPAPPALDPLLTEVEREALALHGAELGPSPRPRLGHERYLGYIACTRARGRLVLACADFDSQGKKLNRSFFFDHVQRLFPELKIETWQPPTGFGEAEHLCEVIPLAIQLQAWRGTLRAPLGVTAAASGAHRVTHPTHSQRPPDNVASITTKRARRIPSPPSEGGEGQGEEGLQLNLFTTDAQKADKTVVDSQSSPELLQLSELADVLAKARQLAAAVENQRLCPISVESLYGRELATSVSALEDFAACPFKFFIGRGLRAEERLRFELDPRERGSFQHEVLNTFHNELAAADRQWRDVSPAAARERVRRIGRELLPRYRHGLFMSDSARRFDGELLIESLETVIEVLVGWARDYQFDPELVEAGFGVPGASLPPWRLELDDGNALLLRGRIDRVDVWRDPATGCALAVVMDYKSSSRKPDRIKLYHGVQLQLPTYLAVLEQLPEARAVFGASRLTPAGVFYVNLRGEFTSAKSRAEALEDPALALRKGFQHAGRFDKSFLEKFDPRKTGEQFNRRGHAPMSAVGFRELLIRATERLRHFGKEIFSGEIAPAPYRKGKEIACQHCDYASVCRFDPWTQSFRSLAEPTETLVTPAE